MTSARGGGITSGDLLAAARNPHADPVPLLLTALDRGSDAIQAEALAFLEEMPSQKAAQSVARVLRACADDFLRCRAAEVLGIIGGPDARNALLGAVGDENALVRLCVAESLGLLDDDAPEITNALGVLVGDGDDGVRIFALESAGWRGDVSVLPSVRALGRQPPPVRVWVHFARHLLGGEAFDFADTLRLLRTGTMRTRTQAAKVLASVATPRTAKRIRRALGAALAREESAGMRETMERFARSAEETIREQEEANK